eukprot:GFYU01004162.1.p1 GENE.GFYU01004162.1~~GFYU01004162.1.p1  ORF type:complete len:223 (+),score=55.68 GFYU01004162.1:28-669(+)
MAQGDEENLFSEQQETSNKGAAGGLLQKSSHPWIAFFHLFFRFLAIFFYVILGWIFSEDFVIVFILCVLLLAADFWTVKNISGRILVGLRWWNNIKDDGTSEWVFESHEGENKYNDYDSRVFWWGLYGTPIIWGVLFIVALMKMNLGWLLVVVVALSLSCANVVGYFKCQKDARKKIQSFITKHAFDIGTQQMAAAASNSNNSGSAATNNQRL